MRVTILKDYNDILKKGVTANVTRDKGIELITMGYAERQDITSEGVQPDPDKIVLNDLSEEE